jgi:hypothetical protein
MSLRRTEDPVVETRSQTRWVCLVDVPEVFERRRHFSLTGGARSDQRNVLRRSISRCAASCALLAFSAKRDHNRRFEVGIADEFLPPDIFAEAYRPVRANGSVFGPFLSVRQTRHAAAWVSIAR